MSKEKTYEPMGVPTKITATSRCAIKIKDNYYTIEASEERALPNDGTVVDMNKEWESLFAEVNEIVDNQCNDIVKTFK